MKYNKHYPIDYKLYAYDNVHFVADEVCFTRRAMTLYGYFEDEPDKRVAAVSNSNYGGFCLAEFDTTEDAADMFMTYDPQTFYVEA